MKSIINEEALIEIILENFSEESVDYEELARKVSEELEPEEVARNIDLEEVARNVSVEDIAENIDLKKLSEVLPYTGEIERLHNRVCELEAKLDCVMEMLESLNPVISILDKIKLVTRG